ncbi:MAG: replication factor C large subunit [Desulfurococcales archaeon]|nr:replication factor C large subunit [Desulfurococcales archaeon]
MSVQARARRLPWVIKYRPRRIDDVVDQERAKKVILPWFRAWLEGRKPSKRALLLYGPPGVGKTSLIEAIASEYDLQLIELNASDYRKAEDVRRVVGAAAKKRPLFKRGIVILLDEIDGIAPKEDAGGLTALMEIIPETENPIVMTANDPWKEQLRPLRNLVEMVQFNSLSLTHIVSLLQRICDAEGLECEREALRFIAEKSMGDLRSAINDLQALAEGYGRVTIGLARAIVRGREKSIDLWRVLNQVFYAKYAWTAKRAVTNSEEDYETLISWLNDNIPRKYSEPGDVFRALDSLSRATVFLSRAKFKGHWALLSYLFDLIGPGVAMARKEGGVEKTSYSYPDRIKLMAMTKSSREIRERLALRLARRLHASSSTVKREILPFLYVIFREAPDPTTAARLAIGYEMNKDEVSLIAGKRSSEILRAIDKIKRARLEPVTETTGKSRPGVEKPGKGKRRAKPEEKRRGLDAFF